MNPFRALWARLRVRSAKPTVAIAINSSEAPPPILAGIEAATDGEEFRRLFTMFQNTVWGREQITAMLTDLMDHIYDDHDEPNECDSWCVPERLNTYLGERSKNQLIILLVVLMRSYLVLHVQHEQETQDP